MNLIDFELNPACRTVRRGKRLIVLTPQEYALLAQLVAHPGTVLSRSQLLQSAWGYACAGQSRTVDVHINRLRRKLDLQQEIVTVYRAGYRFMPRATKQ